MVNPEEVLVDACFGMVVFLEERWVGLPPDILMWAWSLEAWLIVRSEGFSRQSQLPWGRPGTFIRDRP